MKKLLTIAAIVTVATVGFAAQAQTKGMTPTQIVSNFHFRTGMGFSTSGYVQGELGLMIPIQYFDITPSLVISSEGGGYSVAVMHPVESANQTVSLGAYMNNVGNNFGIGPSVEFNFVPSLTLGATLLLGNNQGGLFSAWYNF